MYRLAIYRERQGIKMDNDDISNNAAVGAKCKNKCRNMEPFPENAGHRIIMCLQKDCARRTLAPLYINVAGSAGGNNC